MMNKNIVFTGRDSASVVSLNYLYSYVDNNPLLFFDLFGLDRYTWCGGGDGIAGKPCGSVTDWVCKRFPAYCCAIDKRDCYADCDTSAEEVKKCETDYLKCLLSAGKK
ncbi:MAG: hypothetical protein N0C88_11550 [Candidatus Thiodiazotropha lotti]|uniref:Uncharacterized protein n=1 Tax=Candidatus Thiodiazotropha lotti TaxID=2792787 RepID=A0A9E4N0R2_9GAMM|nr:hypothetical protein [Candidatus Thiodiazotropha lotti]MCW4203941.1 hypothetical protein [Candidatus Thiodiazotropha lotti]